MFKGSLGLWLKGFKLSIKFSFFAKVLQRYLISFNIVSGQDTQSHMTSSTQVKMRDKGWIHQTDFK